MRRKPAFAPAAESSQRRTAKLQVARSAKIHAAFRCRPVFEALAAIALASCAGPQPGLEGADEVLRPPAQAELAALTAKLDHPRLPRVAIDFSRPLTPIELAVIAVVASPDLKAARAKARVAEAQAFSAGLLPDPQITGSYAARLAGPDPLNGWSAGVIYDLVALRERGVVRAGAEAARRQARFDVAWQELQTAGQAELLAARVGGLERAIALQARSRARAEAALARALAAAARGDIRADEVETRRLAAADAATALRQGQASLATAQGDLDRLLGLPPGARLAIAAPAADPTDPGDPRALLETARDQRLDLAALRAGYDSQNAAVRKAIMDAFPGLQLTLARTQDTAGNQTLDPSVTFTLPLWNRNRGGVAIAKATREQLRAEYAARLFATRADIAALVEQLRLEARQRGEIAARIDPVRGIVAATERAAARGDVALAAAETARQSLADKQLALAQLDQAMAEQRVTLALAVGGPLRQ